MSISWMAIQRFFAAQGFDRTRDDLCCNLQAMGYANQLPLDLLDCSNVSLSQTGTVYISIVAHDKLIIDMYTDTRYALS